MLRTLLFPLVVCFVAFWLCSGPVAGQSPYALPKMRYEPVIPIQDRVPERVQTTAPHLLEEEIAATVLIPELKGICVVDRVSKIKLIAPEVHGIEYDTDRAFAFANSAAFHQILQKYVGHPFSIGDLTRLQEEVKKLYERSDMPITGIFAPGQDVLSGSIQLVLIEGRIGSVRVGGSRFSSADFLRSQMNTRRGQRLYESILNEDLRWLNRSSFRDVTVELDPAGEDGFCDLTLRVKEDFPVRGTISYVDNGTLATGIERLQFGVTHGNLWKRDHIFNYTYNTTPDLEKVKVHIVSYAMPFKNRDTFTFFGYHGTMVPNYGVEWFTGTGEVWQTSARYSKLLGVASGKNTRDERRATFGFDFKETNSNLDFGGIRLSETSAQLAQFVFGYSRSSNFKKGYFGYEANLFWSPGKFARNNNDEAFEQLRLGAKAQYVYATLNMLGVRFLNDHFQYNVRFNGQWSGERLLPIEMLGLGGDGSVRGYNTYSRNADSGWIVGNEFATRFKPLGLDRTLPKLPPRNSARKVKDEYQLFVFGDFGGGWNKGAEYYEKKYEGLAGAGVGCRYSFGPWVRLDAAYGWQFMNLEMNNGRDRAHITFSFSR